MNVPTGTITFLFTDIEGSTRLWEERPEAMRLALARHDALMRTDIEENAGVVFKTMGDAFCAAFATAPDALRAALAAQQALGMELGNAELSLRVRMALHAGVAERRDNDYFGAPLNRVARLLATGHGGQILLSDVVQELVVDTLPPSASLRNLGEHRLKDLGRPETVFQLLHPVLLSEFPPLRSLDSPAMPNNLPLQVTSFIGREKEIEAVKSLLGKTRLLTIAGSGGCGKTRLALQVAAEMLENYSDGVWLVELAAISDPTLVAPSVASTLGLREQPGRPLLQTLIDHLESRSLLLALDNCEHLVGACATLVDTLLKACPYIQILATSREGLNIGGESLYRAPSLSTPGRKQRVTSSSVLEYEAVRLFVERAISARPSFAVTDQNAPALAQICHRLDGIPLAIELAAARVRSLSVEDINSRLDFRFRLLTGGSRTALPRQQALQALIDWSYDLLNDQEKILLASLSVFAGGWTLQAAEWVCSGEGVEDWEAVDMLTSLVDKSLALAEEKDGSVRYRMLETVREYATEKLRVSGEEAKRRKAHLDWCLALAEEAEPMLSGPEQAQWLERLEREHDNLRSALAWSLSRRETGEASLRLCGTLSRFWATHGHLGEGRRWCEAALAEAGADRTTTRAKALNGVGNLANLQGDYAAARASFEECLAIKQEIGDRQGIASALSNLGNVAGLLGDYASARAFFEESQAIDRETGDQQGIASSLGNLGNIAHHQGDYASARTYTEESLAIFREIGDHQGIASALGNLGNVAHDQGDYVDARACQEESLAIFREIGDQKGIANSLHNLGLVVCSQGDYASARASYEESLAIYREIGDQRGVVYSLQAFGRLAFIAIGTGLILTETDGASNKTKVDLTRAALLWGAAQALRERMGALLTLTDREEQARETRIACEMLGEADWTTAWAQGWAMSMEQAIAYALTETA